MIADTTMAPSAGSMPARRRRRRGIVFLAVTLLVGAIGGYAVAGGFSTSSKPGQDVVDRVMTAWSTGSQSAIDAAYDPKAVLVLDGGAFPDTMTTIIKGAIAYGNTYRQIGPAAYYKPAAPGDTYVSALIEVTGKDHPRGDPLVGYFRVQSGKVIRHVFIQPRCATPGWTCTPVDVLAP